MKDRASKPVVASTNNSVIGSWAHAATADFLKVQTTVTLPLYPARAQLKNSAQRKFCTNSSEQLQHVRAAQMRQKSAVAVTCGVEMVAAAPF
ncbi:hypothetical protein ACFX13_007705 [Malus domestica]